MVTHLFFLPQRLGGTEEKKILNEGLFSLNCFLCVSVAIFLTAQLVEDWIWILKICVYPRAIHTILPTKS